MLGKSQIWISISTSHKHLYCRKAERKLTLEQFEQAVRMLSETKYPGDPKAMQKLQSKLTTPTTHPGATVMPI